MADQTRRLNDLIDDFNNAMLVTRTPEGELRARPMRIAGHEPDGDLYFATSIESGKVDEMLRYPDVNVAFQGKTEYLSVSGRASLVQDRDKIEKMWEPQWKMWFPEGKEDPNLALIKVHADEGEYWNFETKDTLKFLVEAGKALVKGKQIDYQKTTPGTHGKVDLS